MGRFQFVLAVSMVLGAASTGCVKSMLLSGQVASTRQGSAALDTVGDLEVVRGGAAAGLVQFEGMHELAPTNEDALFLLTKGWTSYSYAFAEDDAEVAHDSGDTEKAEYHKQRAMMGYTRAVGYGLELLRLKDGGFENARKSEPQLRDWLKKNFTTPREGMNLFWLGYAWLARTSLGKDVPELVADLWVGVAILERAVEIDPAYNNYSGLAALASYHARAASAELDEAKKLFDTALAKTDRKFLLFQFAYATRYACAKQDPVLYDRLLREVVGAQNDEPKFRLQNAVARRRAQRWLSEKRMFEMCSMDPVENPADAKKK